MLNIKAIGLGAAGNKAVINLVKKEKITKDNILLLNSTAKDIEKEYADKSIIFGTTQNKLGGCGKERYLGYNLLLNDMKAGRVSFDNFADPSTTNCVLVVASTEGGTGSSTAPIVANYLKNALGVNVILVLLFGFGSDVRGLKNTIATCKDIKSDYGVIAISNAKFLDEDTSTIKAEQKANDYLADIYEILSGSRIVEGDQNIDDSDLYKLVVTPGYMIVGSADISKVKNISQYNKAISEAIDSSKLIDTNPGARRIGVIYDIAPGTENSIDMSGKTLKAEYGNPFELFTHVQKTTSTPSVTWIVSGLNLPTEEIVKIHEDYLAQAESANSDKEKFFETVSGLADNNDEYDLLLKPKQSTKDSKDEFFASYGFKDAQEKVKTKKKNDEY